MKHVVIHHCPLCPVKNLIATRVAARLREEPNTVVETVRGGIGELRVTIDGHEVFKTARYRYPSPDTVIAAVRRELAEELVAAISSR